MPPDTVSLPRFYRSIRVPRRDAAAAADADPTAPVDWEIAISSEEEVERTDPWFGDRWIEILGHKEGEVDLERAHTAGLGLLDTHQTRGLSNTLGNVGNIRVDPDGVLRGRPRFSRRDEAQRAKQDMEDGILPYVSVGYDVHEFDLVGKRDDVPIYRFTRWTPMEVSVVPVPADFRKAGVKRSSDSEELHVARRRESRAAEPAAGREEPMEPKPGAPEQGTQRTEAPPSPGEHGAVVTDPRKDAAEIVRMAEGNDMANRAADWLAAGLTPDQVAGEILKAKRSAWEGSLTRQPASELLQAVPLKDRRNYSYGAALGASLEVRMGGKPGGLEVEVEQEMARQYPAFGKRRGVFLVPIDLGLRGQRAMDSVTAGKGSELVVDQQPAELIEILRNKAQVARMGARIMPGLTAPVPFLKQTADMVVHFVAENPASDTPESDVGTDVIHLAPKSMIGTGSYSRQHFIQTGGLIEQMIRESLGSAHALAIDHEALHGIGGAGYPLGVYNAPDVQPVAMTVPTFGKLVDMTTAVVDQNADLGSMGFLTTAPMMGLLRQTLEASAAGARWIWTGPADNGDIAGYRAVATNQVSKTLGDGANEHGIIFASWPQLIIGFWGALDLLPDPYTLAKKGMVSITSFQMGDVILRHGQSFAKATGAVLAA